MKKNVTIKEYLGMKRIKQVDLVKKLNIDPSKISMAINGIRPVPKKYQKQFCEILGISQEELISNKIKIKTPAPDKADFLSAKLDIAIVALEKIVNSERMGYVISCPEIARMAIQEINNG